VTFLLGDPSEGSCVLYPHLTGSLCRSCVGSGVGSGVLVARFLMDHAHHAGTNFACQSNSIACSFDHFFETGRFIWRFRQVITFLRGKAGEKGSDLAAVHLEEGRGTLTWGACCNLRWYSHTLCCTWPLHVRYLAYSEGICGD